MTRQETKITSDQAFIDDIDRLTIESDTYHGGLEVTVWAGDHGNCGQPIMLNPERLASLLTREEIEEILAAKYRLNYLDSDRDSLLEPQLPSPRAQRDYVELTDDG